MKRNTIISLVLVFVFITATVIYFRYDMDKKEKIIEQLADEYPLIGVGQELEGTITNILHPHPEIFNDDPLQAYISLNDSVKCRIKTGHELKRSSSLDSILTIGDRLIKRRGNDNISIFKIHDGDTLEFTFQLRDDSGYPPKGTTH